MELISGVLKHLALILTFQHTGHGLPKSKSVTHVLAVLALISQLTLSISSGVSPFMVLAQFCVFYALLSYLLPAELVFVAVLTITAMDVLAGLLGLVVVAEEGILSPEHAVIAGWQLAALLFTFHRFHKISKKK